ncbi:SMC-Scp complex subunit ScpB [Candidatus Bathyarchaeota archaeon]|nr:SMC-Scp complex subunit ScpB [Candidatus Bathyarchaeota archaeon]
MISDSLKNKTKLTALEAALYAAGHPLGIEELMHVVSSKSEKVVIGLINELIHKFESRNGALEIKILPGNRVVMQLKSTYNSLVREFTHKPLLKTSSLKTLGYIAYYQPIEQGQVIESRGGHIYSQLRHMEELGLIIRERVDEKRFVIKTTPFFGDYFGIGANPENSKMQFKQIFEHVKVPEIKVQEPVISVPLTDSRDGLADGLPQYPRPAN